MARTLDKKPGEMLYDMDVVYEMLQDMENEAAGLVFKSYAGFVVNKEDPFKSDLPKECRMLLRLLCKSKRKSDEGYLKKAIDGRYYRYKQLCQEKNESYYSQEEWARRRDVFENPSDYIYSTDAQILQTLEDIKMGNPRVPQESPAIITEPNGQYPNEKDTNGAKPSPTDSIGEEPSQTDKQEGSPGISFSFSEKADEGKGEDVAKANKEVPFATDMEIDAYLISLGIGADQVAEFRESRIKPEARAALSTGYDLTRMTWKSWVKNRYFRSSQPSSSHVSEVVNGISYYIPNLEEVQDYCYKKGYRFSPEEFYEKYDRLGWKDPNGDRIRYWEKIADSWEAQEMKKQEQKPGYAKGGLPYL